MSHQKQIFQTDSPKRWKTFVWIARSIIFLLLVALGIICLAILKNSYPQLPKLIGVNEEFKPLNKADKPNEFKRAYKKHAHKIISENEMIKRSPLHSQVRAGFYVSWDSLSLYSLRKNIASMNMVLPEWFFINPNTDTLAPSIDPEGLKVMKQHGVEIVPIINNINDKKGEGVFDGAMMHRIFHNEKKRKRLIDDIVKYLK